MKFQIGDIVCLIDRGDFRAEVVHIPEYHNGHLQISYYEDDVEHLAYASMRELSLVCRMKDTEKIQMASLCRYAENLRFKFDNHTNNFKTTIHPKHRLGYSVIPFNNMVAMHNQDGKTDNKIVDRVKMQYQKRRGKLIVQSHWVEFV